MVEFVKTAPMLHASTFKDTPARMGGLNTLQPAAAGGAGRPVVCHLPRTTGRPGAQASGHAIDGSRPWVCTPPPRGCRNVPGGRRSWPGSRTLSGDEDHRNSSVSRKPPVWPTGLLFRLTGGTTVLQPMPRATDPGSRSLAEPERQGRNNSPLPAASSWTITGSTALSAPLVGPASAARLSTADGVPPQRKHPAPATAGRALTLLWSRH